MWRKQDCLASADVAARLGTFRSRWARAAADGAAAARRGRRQRARKARVKQGLAGEPWRDKNLRRARGPSPPGLSPLGLSPFAVCPLPSPFAFAPGPSPWALSGFEPPQHERGVGAAEAKRIRQSGVDPAPLRLV